MLCHLQAIQQEDMIMCDLSVIHLDLKENGQNQSVILYLL